MEIYLATKNINDSTPALENNFELLSYITVNYNISPNTFRNHTRLYNDISDLMDDLNHGRVTEEWEYRTFQLTDSQAEYLNWVLNHHNSK